MDIIDIMMGIFIGIPFVIIMVGLLAGGGLLDDWGPSEWERRSMERESAREQAKMEWDETKGLWVNRAKRKAEDKKYRIKIAKFRDRPISDLNLSLRVRKCMVRLDMNTIGELLCKTGDEMLECKNFGVKSLNEVRGKLEIHGLKIRGEADALYPLLGTYAQIESFQTELSTLKATPAEGIWIKIKTKVAQILLSLKIKRLQQSVRLQKQYDFEKR